MPKAPGILTSLSLSHTQRQAQCSLPFCVCGFCSNQGWAGGIPVRSRPRPGSLCALGCLPPPLTCSLVDVGPATVGNFVAHPVAVPALPQVEVIRPSPAAWPQKPGLVHVAEGWKPLSPAAPALRHSGQGNARPRGQEGRLHRCHHPEGLGFTTPPPGRRRWVGLWSR